MKKTAILLSLGMFLAVSCENIKPEPQPQVSKVSFTPCKQDIQPSKLKSSELSSNVKVEFTAEGVHITYHDFEVTCDFTDVNVTHTLVNGVLNITQQGSPNQAKCICYTDVSYTIEGISQNEINVIFINGEQVYCYNENVTLQGTKWKLAGIVDTQTGELKELEPKDCVKCYTIVFGTDSVFKETSSINIEAGWYKIFTGNSTSNFIVCWYKIDYKTGAFHIYNIGGTEVGEVGDGYLYRQILLKIQSFTVKDTYLHLYYDDGKNYLIFKETGS